MLLQGHLDHVIGVCQLVLPGRCLGAGTAMHGLVSIAVGPLAVAAKATETDSEWRNGGSVNAKAGSAACSTASHWP
jgi:hypothetical protein